MLIGIFLLSLEFLLLSSLTFYVGCVHNPDFAIYISYNAIYYYSKLEMQSKKMKKMLTKTIDNNPSLKNVLSLCTNHFTNNINQNDVDFVKNGEIILSTNKNILLNEPSIVPDEFDFIVYSENTTVNNDVSVLHKKIFKQIPNSFEDFQCEKVDYKFIMLDIHLDDKQITLDLSNDKFNYLIKNNELDKHFINYYLKKYLPHENVSKNKDLHDCDYSIKYIDHNVNIGELDKTHIIVIKEKDVIIEKKDN